MNLSNTIISIAKGYVGQEEIRENKGFKNKDFEQKIKNVGWYVGAPWCAFLAKLIWQEAFTVVDSQAVQLIKRYSNGSALDTYHNYAKSKEFHVSHTPVIGAIVIWQEGDGTSGHAGVVLEVTNPTTIKTIEGNTNTDGSREGYIVAIKTRVTNLSHSKGLNLVGFIYPSRIA